MKVRDGVYECDVCKRTILKINDLYKNLSDGNEHLHDIAFTAGYGSKFDGEEIKMHICEKCLENLVDTDKVLDYKKDYHGESPLTQFYKQHEEGRLKQVDLDD